MDAAEIITAAQRIAGRVDADFNARSLEFINEAVEHWALALPWSTLRTEIDLVTDGTRFLVFPDYVRTIRWMADKSNKNTIDPKEMWDRDLTDTFLSDTTGGVFNWKEEGIEPVFTQPASAAQISVRSEVSDTFQVHITGFALDTAVSGTAGERYFTEEIMNVSSSDAHTSTASYVQVRSIGCNKTRSADLLILNGSTKIGRIPSNGKVAKYRKVSLIRIPSAGTNILAGVILQPNRITNVSHVPHPSINPEYLKHYCAGLIHKAMNQGDMANQEIGRANQILAQRVQQEKIGGDRDLGLIPDQGYWGSEEFEAWPRT